MVKQIITDPMILSRKSTSATQEDIQTVGNDLLDTVKANADNCVGMAANMIGVHKTILVALIGLKYQLMLNPKIIDKSKQVYDVEESCLSLNGERMVTRYKTITVEYYDAKFKKKKKTFKGFEAQVIQHEMDHFYGILI